MKRFIVRYLPLGVLIAMASQLFADDDLCGNNFTGAPSAAPPSLHVGVILVQFSDWQGNVDSRGSHCQRHGEVNHYTVQEFNRHLFSQNIYRTPDPDDLNSEPRTHDREAIFGSMRDFYDENSYGKFLLTGEILNDSTFNEITEKWVPVWVTLNQTKGAWDSLGINPTRLLDSTLAVSGIDTTGFEKMILIYAGEERRDGLNPATSGNRFVYQIGEKKKGSSTRGRTNTPGTFYGIGTHCHEFGHLLFLPDLKGGSTQIRGLSEWDLMAVGNQGFMDGDPFNETIGGYHAPTHLGGWSKLCLGWANYEEFTEGNLTFPHFEEDDQICVYFINDSDPSNWDEGEYFIFENRRPTFSDGARTFDGDMHRDATVGGLLIVHHNDASPSQFSNGLDLKVIEADNNNSVGESVGAGNMADIYPGVNDNTEFSESSTPSSNDVDGNPTGLALLNITNNNGVVSTIVDFGPPAAPQNLVIANPSEDGANPILQWDANTEPDLNHYLVWRGTTPNWKTTPITWETSPAANVTVTTWTDNETFIDLDVLSATYYRVTAVDDANNESDYSNTTSTTSSNIHKAGVGEEKEERTTAIPIAFALHQNFPNPFNPQTEIRFELPAANHVTLEIYNVLGEKIRTLTERNLTAGFHAASWDGKDDRGQNVPSGLYIYRMVVTSRDNGDAVFSQTKKLTLLR